MTNPYAPPQAVVQDVVDPQAGIVLADRGARLGAAILDGLLMLPIYIGLIMAIAGGETSDAAANPALVAGGVFVMFVSSITWIWLTVLFVRRNGQTIAKKLLGIKVVRSDGSRASFGRIFWLRNVVNTLIGIVPLYGVIDILFVFGDTRRCLHDHIADTIVVVA
jgi:uncharacterized RDD family membrane protein YckC